MPWFYVDDGFSDSKPVLNMPARHRLAACGLWVLAGSWSAKEETDGRVPEAKLRQLGARPALIDVLTEQSEFGTPLWSRVGREVQFNSWSKWQKTHAELVKQRAAAAERQRESRGRKVKGRNHVTSEDDEPSQRDSHVTTTVTETAVTGDVTRDPHARARRPDPTHPLKETSGPVLDDSYVSNAHETEPPDNPWPDTETNVVNAQAPEHIDNASRPTKRTPSGGARWIVRQELGHIGNPYPRNTHTRLANAVDKLLADNCPEPDIREALKAWDQREDCPRPEYLETVYSDTIKAKRATPGNTGGTVHKMRATANLATEIRQAETQAAALTNHQPKELA